MSYLLRQELQQADILLQEVIVRGGLFLSNVRQQGVPAELNDGMQGIKR